MAAVPTLPVVTGGVYTTSQVSQLVTAVAFLLNPPIAELRQTVAQTLTTAVVTAVLFDAEDVDSANGHSTSTNTSRYTAQYPGQYQVSCGVSFAANATGQRFIQLKVNGVDTNGSGVEINANAALDTLVPGRTKQVYLNVGDFVEAYVFQNSGGNLNTAPTTYEAPHMSIRWVSN